MNLRHIMYRRSRFLKKGVYPVRDIAVIKSIRLSEMIKNMDYDRYHLIHVLDYDLSFIKTVTEQQIIDGLLKYGGDVIFEKLLEE